MISVRRFGSLPASIFLLTSGFLQIPPHDGHPCLRLTLPTAERVVVSHHLVVAHAGRTKNAHQQAANRTTADGRIQCRQEVPAALTISNEMRQDAKRIVLSG